MDKTKTFAFVLMPFDAEFNDIYKFGIKETAEKLGILAQRVDEQIYNEGILDRIYRQIEAADIVIADMTGRNPNVFYEVGYSHAKNKLCILLTSDANDIPFDLKHRRHLVYGNSIDSLRMQLSRELEWALQEISKIRQTRIRINLQPPIGSLDKTTYSAEGEVTFKFDLQNESLMPSSEIEAIYFYTSSDWRLFQDGKECPSTESDLAMYSKRHFLIPPLRRLQPNAWAQLTFASKRTLATSWKGQPLLDSYRLAGHSVLRLVTNEGNIDYPISIDVTVEEIAF